jgi:hypothetical protein
MSGTYAVATGLILDTVLDLNHVYKKVVNGDLSGSTLPNGLHCRMGTRAHWDEMSCTCGFLACRWVMEVN